MRPLPSYQPGVGVAVIFLEVFRLPCPDCMRSLGNDGYRRTVLLHDVQETDDDLGGRTDQDLALAGLLGVVDGVKRIVENGGLHFDGGFVRRFCSGEAASGI